jgi:hypothetical protein
VEHNFSYETTFIQQFCLSDHVECYHVLQDPVALYMESIHSEVFNVVAFDIQSSCNSKYKLHITCLLNFFYLHFFI